MVKGAVGGVRIRGDDGECRLGKMETGKGREQQGRDTPWERQSRFGHVSEVARLRAVSGRGRHVPDGWRVAGAWRVRGRQVKGSRRIWRAAALVPTDGPAATEVGELHTPGALATPSVATPGAGVELHLHLSPAWSPRLQPSAGRRTGPECPSTSRATVRHRHAARARRVQMERLWPNGAIMEPPLRPLPLDKQLHNAIGPLNGPPDGRAWRASPKGVWDGGADAHPSCDSPVTVRINSVPHERSLRGSSSRLRGSSLRLDDSSVNQCLTTCKVRLAYLRRSGPAATII